MSAEQSEVSEVVLATACTCANSAYPDNWASGPTCSSTGCVTYHTATCFSLYHNIPFAYFSHFLISYHTFSNPPHKSFSVCVRACVSVCVLASELRPRHRPTPQLPILQPIIQPRHRQHLIQPRRRQHRSLATRLATQL